jgi:hypothetical protein
MKHAALLIIAGATTGAVFALLLTHFDALL